MKKAYLYSGMLVLFIFALSGQYMLHVLDLPNTELDVQRMMYHASHIYLLLAGAANTLVGCYWVKVQGACFRPFNRLLRF